MNPFSNGDQVELELSPFDAQTWLDILEHAGEHGTGGGCSDYYLPATDEAWELLEKMGAANLRITVEEYRQHEDYRPRRERNGKFGTEDFSVYYYFKNLLKAALERHEKDQAEREERRAKYEAEEKRLEEAGLVKPRFSNGTEFESWCERNCNRCVKSYVNSVPGGPRANANDGTFNCKLEEEGLGGWLNGDPIPLAMAERLGYEEGDIFMGDCTEREPTPLPLILVTGSRNVTDADHVQHALVLVIRRLFPGHPSWELVHDDCRGVDHAARDLFQSDTGRRRGYVATPFPADFRTYGPAAGPMRNGQMVKYALERETALGEPPVFVVAIPDKDSRGTWDCVFRAADAGLPILVLPYTEEASGGAS